MEILKENSSKVSRAAEWSSSRKPEVFSAVVLMPWEAEEVSLAAGRITLLATSTRPQPLLSLGLGPASVGCIIH